jgi:zinc transport system permease protein
MSELILPLICAVLLAVPSALLGNILVLKRVSNIGDGLSHAGYGLLVCAAALRLSPFWVSLPVCAAIAVLLLVFGGKLGDAYIAVISSAALAVGGIVSNYSGTDFDEDALFFGSLDEITLPLTLLAGGTALAFGIFYILFYTRIFALTFDEKYARALKMKVTLLLITIAIFAAIFIVTAMRITGALLVSGLMIFPALSALRCAKSFIALSVISVCVSVSAAIIGICLAQGLSLPAGACVVAVNTILYLVITAVSKLTAK